MQDELNVEIRDKKRERNHNSKAFSENRRLSQSVRELIRAKKVDEARRACEEQVNLVCHQHIDYLCSLLTAVKGRLASSGQLTVTMIRKYALV